MLTEDDIKDFQALHNRLYGDDISFDQARQEAQMALDLMRIIRDEELRED